MTEPKPVENGSASVLLDGRQWPVKRFVWQYLRQVRDPIYELSDQITEPHPDKPGFTCVSETRFQKLTPEQYEAMGRVVYLAIKQTHPDLTPEEFDNFAFGDFDLLNAFLIVRLQSGQYVAVPDGDEQRPLAQAERSAA